MALSAEVVWAPVVAALGASLLTTGGLLVRDVVTRKLHANKGRTDAYEVLLARSAEIVLFVSTLRTMMATRSSVVESGQSATRAKSVKMFRA
jgi:hypothetical protein